MVQRAGPASLGVIRAATAAIRPRERELHLSAKAVPAVCLFQQNPAHSTRAISALSSYSRQSVRWAIASSPMATRHRPFPLPGPCFYQFERYRRESRKAFPKLLRWSASLAVALSPSQVG